MTKSEDTKRSSKSRTLLHVGVILIIIGAWSIVGKIIGGAFDIVGNVVGFVLTLAFDVFGLIAFGVILIVVWALLQAKSFSKKYAKKQEIYINADPNADININRDFDTDTIFVNITHDTADIPPVNIKGGNS